MKKSIVYTVVLMLLTVSASTVFASNEITKWNSTGDVLLIYDGSKDTSVGIRSLASSSGDAKWDCDGKREYKSEKVRVNGWSTCKNNNGTNLEHYTHSYFSPIGNDDTVKASDGKTYGTGKVRDYSKYVIEIEFEGCIATVKYGF